MKTVESRDGEKIGHKMCNVQRGSTVRRCFAPQEWINRYVNLRGGEDSDYESFDIKEEKDDDDEVQLQISRNISQLRN